MFLMTVDKVWKKIGLCHLEYRDSTQTKMSLIICQDQDPLDSLFSRNNSARILFISLSFSVFIVYRGFRKANFQVDPSLEQLGFF